MSDALPPQPPHAAPGQLASRLEFETLISDSSAALFAVPPEQVETVVEQALERARVFFEADRCALLSVSDEGRCVNVRLASYAKGVPAVPSDLNLARMFTWAARKLLVERVPVLISSTATLPPEAEVDRPGRERLGFRSALALPIETGTEIRHLVAIQTVDRERDWPDILVQRLRVFAGLLVGALERKQVFAELREAEARLKAGADLAGLGFYEVDFGRGVAWGDDRLRDICGVAPGRRQGLQVVEHWLAHLHAEDLPLVLALRTQLHDGRLDRFALEYRYLHPDRGERWLRHLASASRRDAVGRAVVTYGVLRDVTEQKRAVGERSDLGRRLLRAQEDERAQLARELHDDVTQRLAVLAIDAGRAELACGDEAQAGQLRAIREGLSRLSEDVHSLAYQLHPAVLEELGLVEALRTACERFERRDGVALSVDLAPVPGGLEKEVALCLFRVAQEALNNVARHARAGAASVTLRTRDGGLLLAVRDDGVGFDPADPETRRRLGMASMRERVRLVNGTLEVESAPGRGTAVVAWVPTAGGTP